MKSDEMIEKALDRIMNELDEIEGGSAMAHEMDECPDPLSCKMHESDESKPLVEEEHPSVKVEIHKHGLPSLDGVSEEAEEGKAEDGLSAEEAEQLKKLLR